MMQNRLKFILITVFFCIAPQVTQAGMATNSLRYALLKAIIEGGKTGAFHQAEETYKSLNPVTKSTGDSIKMDPINTFNLTEATFEWILNCILQKSTGRTLCSGRSAGIIDYHKLIKVAIMEAARLGVTPASATNDKIIRLYIVNVLRALSVRGFALDSNFFPTANKNSALALNCLNERFWEDLIAGTVDWDAVKDLGGKYRDLKSGLGFVAIDNVLGFADDKAGILLKAHPLDTTKDHHIKFITDLTFIFVFPILKYLIEYGAHTNYKTPTAALHGIEKTMTPVINKICAGTTLLAQTGQKVATPVVSNLQQLAISLYKKIAQTAYNITHPQPDEDDEDEETKEENTQETKRANKPQAQTT